jgi:hypothetical protein
MVAKPKKKRAPKRRDHHRLTGKVGKPAAHVPSDELRAQIRSLIINGTPLLTIAAYIGIAVGTLYRHYAREIQFAFIEVGANVGSSMVRSALDPKDPNHHDARKYWLSRRGGWKETSIVENTGAIGVFDFSNLTDGELANLERLLTRATPVLGPEG